MKTMRSSLVVLLFLCAGSVNAQPVLSAGLPAYPFIHYQVNRFDLVHDNPAYKTLYSKFDTLLREGTNRVNIVHFGGSHIQADIYTHKMRQELQSMFPGMLGSRGFFFPFKLARTNTPPNLWIEYTGDWISSKNTQMTPTMVLGVSGITATLVSDTGTLRIVARYDSVLKYDFNRIRIYCNSFADSCLPEVLPKQMVQQIVKNPLARYIQYDLNLYTDTLNLLICRGDTLNPFSLYGISLENDDPGITYNSIGVNGAMLKSYLQCGLFSEQLKSLDPDWIIISIGTNEGNTRQFEEASYRNEYIRMIDLIKKSIPDAAILLTVPNDSYLHKRYINNNTAVMRDIIYELAATNGCGVWDFYAIMGGLNSAKQWYNSGLMAKDHIHFNKAGYLLKGDLFFNAFLNSWNDPTFTGSGIVIGNR
jgi:lysophospholipase L1-like esterase